MKKSCESDMPTLDEMLAEAPAVLNAIDQRATGYGALGDAAGAADRVCAYREQCRRQLFAVVDKAYWDGWGKADQSRGVTTGNEPPEGCDYG